MILVKKYWILIGLLVLLLGGTLIYFNWAKQKPELTKPHFEQTEPESVREAIIPSSLDSEQVIIEFADYMHLFGEMITREHRFWVNYFGIVSPSKGFIEGTFASWQGETYYIKKDGTKIKGPDDPLSFSVTIAVLKYEKPQFAQEDHDRISIGQEFSDFTLNGVRLRTKVGLAPGLERMIEEYPVIKLEPEQFQQYLLYSGNFIIYAVGLKEASEDVIIRVIDWYAAE